MAAIDAVQLTELWGLADAANTADAKGAALEEIICFLLCHIPGVGHPVRNQINKFGTEELDVLLWNAGAQDGLHFMGTTILVECKNWSKPVDGQEVVYFAYRLWQRRATDGILVAANGITGHPGHLEHAHFEIGNALATLGVRILVLRRTEIELLHHSDELVDLLRQKRMELDATGTTLG